MDRRLQLRVQRYGWDRASDFYDRYWEEQLKPAQDMLLELADLRAGERVLETACGTGLVTFRMAELVGTSGEVLGTDISDNMVETARRLATERGLGNIKFDRMDTEAVTVEEGAYDAAVCSLGLMYTPDPTNALAALSKALKSGGRTVAAVWGHRGKCGWAEIFPIVDARVSTEVCPMFFQLGTGDALRYSFENAGYKDVHTERVSTMLHYDNADDAIGAAFIGGPVAMAYSRFDDKTREEAHAEYAVSIEPYRQSDGTYRIPGEFVVTRGVKP